MTDIQDPKKTEVDPENLDTADARSLRGAPVIDPELNKRLLRKIDWRIMPVVGPQIGPLFTDQDQLTFAIAVYYLCSTGIPPPSPLLVCSTAFASAHRLRSPGRPQMLTALPGSSGIKPCSARPPSSAYERT